MINLVALARAARELTSDAVRFGAMLAVMPHAMDDEGVLRLDFKNRQAEKLFFMHPALLRKCARELEEAGLLRRVGRTGFCAVPDSTSDPSRILALPNPPWTSTQADDDKSTTRRVADITTSADALATSRREHDEHDGHDAAGERSERLSDSQILTDRSLTASEARPEGGKGPRRDGAEHSDTRGGLNGVVRPEPSGKSETPHTRIMREYSDRFFAATNVRPGISPRDGKAVKNLLAGNHPDEIVRRIGIMLGETRKWPPPPYTLSTLADHFALFAVTQRKNTGHVDNDPAKTGPAYYGPLTDLSAPWPKNDRKPIR